MCYILGICCCSFTTMVPCKHCGTPVKQSSVKGGRKKEYCNESCRNKWRYKTGPVRDTYTEQKERGYKNKWRALQHRGGKCIVCGETNPAMLCFHHRDPSKKTLKLDSRTFANRKWETICEEVERCDIYCHNHHFELHYGPSWEEMKHLLV